jgi:hypothetical protein
MDGDPRAVNRRFQCIFDAVADGVRLADAHPRVDGQVEFDERRMAGVAGAQVMHSTGTGRGPGDDIGNLRDHLR